MPKPDEDGVHFLADSIAELVADFAHLVLPVEQAFTDSIRQCYCRQPARSLRNTEAGARQGSYESSAARLPIILKSGR